MGHDYIDFHDRHIRISDWDIWTLRHFFQHVAEEASPADLGTDQVTVVLLREFLESWVWLGPGVITGTNLSEFVAHQPERVNVLLSLFQQTMEYLHEFGEVVPLEYLEKYVNTPDAYYTVEQPTSRFIEAVESLREMVRGC